jgi:hypothetical protein
MVMTIPNNKRAPPAIRMGAMGRGDDIAQVAARHQKPFRLCQGIEISHLTKSVDFGKVTKHGGI